MSHKTEGHASRTHTWPRMRVRNVGENSSKSLPIWLIYSPQTLYKTLCKRNMNSLWVRGKMANINSHLEMQTQITYRASLWNSEGTRLRSKWDPYRLLVGMPNAASIWEPSSALPYEVKYAPAIWFSMSHSGCLLKTTKTYVLAHIPCTSLS